MAKRLNHAGLVQMRDESFVRDILDQMEGKSNTAKAKAIVKRLGKRMRAYQREREQAKHLTFNHQTDAAGEFNASGGDISNDDGF